MDFLKKFTKKKKGSKSVSLKSDNKVAQDWVIALFVMFGLTLVISTVSAFIFLSSQEIDFTEAEVSDRIRDIVDEELLTNTIDLYSEREDEFSSYERRAPSAPRL